MKIKLFIIFVLVLSLALFCSCGKTDNEKGESNSEALSVEGGNSALDTTDISSNAQDSELTETETFTENTTAKESETSENVTEDTTEPDVKETESATEMKSEIESESETQRDKQEIMDEIYNSTENIQLPIGGWSTPASALRDGYTGVEGSYDKMYELISKTGINYMITLEEWSSGSWPLESLSSAAKAGMKLYYNCVGMDAPYSLEKINALLNSEYAYALGGIYVKDEPLLSELDELATLTSDIRAGLEGVEIPVFSNLLPTYANSGMIGDDYRTYVREYIEKTNPDILMFDYYPYHVGTGDSIAKMMANIAIGIEEAKAAGIPLYTFIQSSGSSGMREPSYEELKLDMHLNLAMGVKGVAYFLCCEHYDNWGYTTMIDYEGNTTVMYNKIAKVNSEINAMKGVYLNYDFKGVMLSKYTAGETAISSVSDSILLDSFAPLVSISSAAKKSFAVGCFEGDEGVGFYAVNLNYKIAGDLKLEFDSEVEYEIWGGDGLMDVGVTENNTLSISLDKGEGVFIKIK